MMAARAYAPGTAEGEVLRLSEPLSFYGGVDALTGDIIDHSHADRGKNVAGKILVMPSGRGSSSSSSVLAEIIRAGTGPIGIILERPDPIMTVGCLVAQSLYDLCCPLVVAPIGGFADGDRLRIVAGETPDAAIHIVEAPRG
jgi:predicted aconitase with swiveling domain